MAIFSGVINEWGRNGKLLGGGGGRVGNSDSVFSHASVYPSRLYPSQSICDGYGGRCASVRTIEAGRLVFQFPTPPPRKKTASACTSVAIGPSPDKVKCVRV